MNGLQHGSKVHAVIQAGGRGERLRPLTDQCPKPMLKVGGVPMVEWVLRGLLSAGVKQVTIVTGYLGNVISKHIESLDLGGVELSFFEESTALGNIGALGQLQFSQDLGVFAFGDLFTDLNYSELLRRSMLSHADILLTSHQESHRLRLGELLIDGDKVRGYQEKPLKTFQICSGICVFRRKALDVMAELPVPCGMSDWIAKAIEKGLLVEHWQHGAFWMDVNTPGALAEANRRYSEVIASQRHPADPA